MRLPKAVFVILSILVVCQFTCVLAAEKEEIKPAHVVHLHLSGTLSDQLAPSSMDLSATSSMPKLIHGLDKLSRDPYVDAVVLTFDSMSFGTGQLEELRAAFHKVRKQDKALYVHAEGMSTGIYALLSESDYLAVAPESSLMLTGLYSETMYMKGLLDRLDIHADFLAMGDYKSAAETMTRTGPSEAAEANLNWLLDGIFDNIVTMIAESRDMEPEEVKSLIDKGLFTADEALEEGLIDAIQTKQAFLETVVKDLGGRAVFNNRYGQKKRKQINISSPFALFSALSELLKTEESHSEKDLIAVVQVQGTIMPGYDEVGLFGSTAGAFSGTLEKALQTLAKDDKVKAVVMRVNSPGGSALASEVILNAARSVQAKKPFVVSMGNTAASGGYYIACAADAIYANRSTITGSIGVVGGKIVTQGLWDKIGITFSEHKRGANADLFTSAKAFDKDQKAVYRSHMEAIYNTFKGHVVKGRGYRLRKDIDDLAGGRVYTGKQALELGLVDYLGGLEQAIACAAEKASLSEYDVCVVPESKDLITQLLEELNGTSQRDTDVSLVLSQILLPALDNHGSLLKLLQNTQPKRAQALIQALQRIALLHKENVLAMMPYDLIVE